MTVNAIQVPDDGLISKTVVPPLQISPSTAAESQYRSTGDMTKHQQIKILGLSGVNVAVNILDLNRI